ncbi:hypothetical protein ABOM_010254 [Aspergillus bombycis]|uniref:Uncharacterized protein n=1 Tax=Aspergillus bombycis TaxID=109264 RepID=A0A1F7ZQQ2_9EURO|nr:hypothetical protein ABOM_010254 [Aspergillus bombycis]OGM41405.1 hypothetical protein ABOM_010254 [Aspergillus bombycis]
MSAQISESSFAKKKGVIYAQYRLPSVIGGDKSWNEVKEDGEQALSVLVDLYKGWMIGAGEVTLSRQSNNDKVDYFCVKMGEYERCSEPSVKEAGERLFSIIRQLLNSWRRADDIEKYDREGIF